MLRSNGLTWLAGLALSTVVVAVRAEAAPNNHGIEEFTKTGTWAAPAGTKSVTIEMWGGGGGGGLYNGVAGGSGAYSHSVVAVKPHKTYTVVVGAGGAPDANGGDSQFQDPDGSILLFAGGGVTGNSGGAPGAEDPNAMIHRPGNQAGTTRTPSAVGNANPAPGFDGSGGVPGTFGSDGSGNPGYVLLGW